MLFSNRKSLESSQQNPYRKPLSTITLIQHEIRDEIELIKEYGDLPAVYCQAGELNQVFMTLLMNAIQAIEDKGTITIQTSADADQVRIDISDSGKGISPEQLKTIFDFSFTTKDKRIGMSMGLSNAYNIIQSHHGQLQVDSRLGEGTTFTITLPLNGNKN